MNTAIHKTLWLLLIGATFISCAKNDTGEEDISPVPGSGNELSGELLLIEEKVNGQTLFKFEYDERNRVVLQRITTAGSDIVHSFTYDDRDRLIAVDRKDDVVFLNESYTYEDNEDRPVGGVWTFHSKNGDDNVVPVQYAYAENTVTETVLHQDAVQTFTYTFNSKGNQLTANFDGALQEYNDYDDKKSCYTHYPWAWKIHYVNNARSVKIAGLIDQIWEFTYNEAGYPQTARVYNRGADEVVETHEYFYERAN